jgi:hypothetical protein
MATNSKPVAVEAGAEHPGGYQPELKRTLGSFQVFAVAVGIFGTYDDLLETGGPIAIWLWVIVAVGQTLVALVIAQFAARIPSIMKFGREERDQFIGALESHKGALYAERRPSP